MTDRLHKVRHLLQKQQRDAVLISKTSNIFYLTGYAGFAENEREAYLFITKRKGYLFTSALHFTAVKQTVKNLTICKLSGEKYLTDWLAEILPKQSIQTLGIEETDLTVSEYVQIRRIIPQIKPIDLTSLRIQKDAAEIDAIAKACAIGDKAFSYILPKIKAGMTEKEIAVEMELFIRKKGVHLSFPSIVAVNANAAIPHHVTDDTKVTKESLILFDFGVKYDGYCSDMSRTVFLGTPSEKQKSMYLAVRNAQQKAAEYIQTQLKNDKKIKTSEPDKIARNHITTEGFPQFPHSLGHGIGVDVHEPYRLSPYSDGYLDEGMVFSIEPGIYIPDFGGVRIEDLYVIEKKTLRVLTHSSKDLLSLGFDKI